MDYVNGYFCKCPVEVYGINCETGEQIKKMINERMNELMKKVSE